MRLFILIGFLLTSTIVFAQYYTPSQIDAIHAGLTAQEGDMYKDTVNDLQYIGVTDGSLKLLSPYLIRVIQVTNNYTISLGESSAVITVISSTPVTLTIPAGLPVGYNISIYQTGTGQVTIAGAGGVTVRNRLSIFRTAGQDAGVGVICTSTNTFHITGDLTK